jgi:calcineurin-like phosphoesterase family protein
MARDFFIADLHLGHGNILRYERAARPFAAIAAHDAELIRRWNARVGRDDVVWVLGDFAWSPAAARAALAQLNGRIRLVLGDHDAQWLATQPGARDRLALDAVEQVHGAVKWRPGVLLTHVPAIPGPKYRVNLHGHLHSRAVAHAGAVTGDGDAATRHVCVSVEHTDLAPRSWAEIAEELAAAGVRLP